MTDIQKDIIERMTKGWTLMQDVEITSASNTYLERGTQRYAVHKTTFHSMREKNMIALSGKHGRRAVYALTTFARQLLDAVNGVGGEA